MKLNKKIIILTTLIFIIVMTMMTTTVRAEVDANFFAPSQLISEGIFTQKAGMILGIIRTIGILVAVIVLTGIGIKYIVGSVEQKADYKKAMIPYVVGCFLLIGTSGLLGMIGAVSGEGYIVNGVNYWYDRNSETFHCENCGNTLQNEDMERGFCTDCDQLIVVRKCRKCGDQLDIDEVNKQYCTKCEEPLVYIKCVYCGEQLIGKEIENTLQYCTDCGKCDRCSNELTEEELDNRNKICTTCVADISNRPTCGVCGNIIWEEEYIELEHGGLCANCAEDLLCDTCGHWLEDEELKKGNCTSCEVAYRRKTTMY